MCIHLFDTKLTLLFPKQPFQERNAATIHPSCCRRRRAHLLRRSVGFRRCKRCALDPLGLDSKRRSLSETRARTCLVKAVTMTAISTRIHTLQWNSSILSFPDLLLKLLALPGLHCRQRSTAIAAKHIGRSGRSNIRTQFLKIVRISDNSSLQLNL